MKARKEKIRQEMGLRLKQQTEEDRLKKSRVICDKVVALPEFKRAELIFVYLSVKGEVDTLTILNTARARNKTVALPFIDPEHHRMGAIRVDDFQEELVEGPYGIHQPKDQSQEVPKDAVDCVLVPGLAFSRLGHRLGRGKGYYDRFLASLPSSTPTIGLAFDFQVLNELPCENHDVILSRVISN